MRDAKPTPPEAARLYAYAATAYADALDAGATAAQAGHAVVTVVDAVRPTSAVAFAAATSAAGLDPSIDAGPADVVAAVERLIIRAKADGFDNAVAPTEPAGAGLWRAVDGKPPLSPTAGSWRRWLVADSAFSVPEPPAPGSAEQQAQLAAVKRAVAARDARWANRINFWGGAPGTNTPAGIWQDVLADELKGSPTAADDTAYAHLQSDLARTLADAFVETWKVKFTYWTARPDMVDPSVTTAMPDPRFPGYVSGHSTVSAAAAMLLALLVPGKAAVWMADAEEARDSRLMAGIHFPIDNDAGFELGRQVGKVAVGALHRRPVAFDGPPEMRPARLAVPAGVLVDASGSSPTDLAATEDAGEPDGTLPIVPGTHSPGDHPGSGVLVRLSKSGYDRSMLAVVDENAIGQFAAAPGWTLTRLDTDAIWTPSACGGSPTAIVGNRWIVYLEGVQPEADGSYRMRLVSFDLVTRRFASYLPEPNDVPYGGVFVVAGAHSIDIGFAQGPTGRPTKLRRIDLRDGAYRDRAASLDPFETASDLLDGVRFGTESGGADVVFTRADGGVHARIHAYRQPRPIAWSGPYGYVQAFDGSGTDDLGRYDLGVYDIRSGIWDWVFERVPDGGAFLALGAVAA